MDSLTCLTLAMKNGGYAVPPRREQRYPYPSAYSWPPEKYLQDRGEFEQQWLYPSGIWSGVANMFSFMTVAEIQKLELPNDWQHLIQLP